MLEGLGNHITSLTGNIYDESRKKTIITNIENTISCFIPTMSPQSKRDQDIRAKKNFNATPGPETHTYTMPRIITKEQAISEAATNIAAIIMQEEDLCHTRNDFANLSKKALHLGLQNMVGQECGFEDIQYFFAFSMLTPALECDIQQIAVEFFNEKRSRMTYFKEHIVETCSSDHLSTSQRLAIDIINLIYAGALLEDKYCKELLKSIYKNYHKAEYNVVKRFRKMSLEDLTVLFNESDSRTMPRAIAMCQILEIEAEYEPYCYIAHMHRERDIKEHEKRRKNISLLQELMVNEGENHQFEEKCRELVSTSTEDLSDIFLFTKDFLGKILNTYGFSGDYYALDSKYTRDWAIKQAMIYNEALNKGKAIDNTKLQIVAALLMITEMYVDAKFAADDIFSILIGEKDDEETFIKLSGLKNLITNTQSSTKQNDTVQNVLASTKTKEKNIEEPGLTEVEQMNRLKEKIRKLEQDNEALRSKNKSLQEDITRTEAENAELNKDKKELHELRSFMFHLQEEAQIVIDKNLEKEKEQAIADKKILIIGGDQNWTNKLKNMFPKWLIAGNDVSPAASTRLVSKCDYAFFFTDHISHSLYTPMVNALRNSTTPFGYIKGVNIEQNIVQIYATIFDEK